MAGRAFALACLFRVLSIGRNGCPPERGYLNDLILKMEMRQPEAAAY